MRISDWSSDVCSSDLNSAGWTPRWQIVPRLSWDSRGFARASLTGRFVSSYQDSIALVSGPNAGEFQTLGNFWMLDLNVDLAIGSLFIDTRFLSGARLSSSEEHTSVLQSLMRISYAVFCL